MFSWLLWLLLLQFQPVDQICWWRCEVEVRRHLESLDLLILTDLINKSLQKWKLHTKLPYNAPKRATKHPTKFIFHKMNQLIPISFFSLLLAYNSSGVKVASLKSWNKIWLGSNSFDPSKFMNKLSQNARRTAASECLLWKAAPQLTLLSSPFR